MVSGPRDRQFISNAEHRVVVLRDRGERLGNSRAQVIARFARFQSGHQASRNRLASGGKSHFQRDLPNRGCQFLLGPGGSEGVLQRGTQLPEHAVFDLDRQREGVRHSVPQVVVEVLRCDPRRCGDRLGQSRHLLSYANAADSASERILR